PTELAPDAGRAAGAVRVQFEPDAVAAVVAGAARRRPSGADAAGISGQRSLDGADAALPEGARLRPICLEHGPQLRRRVRQAAGAADAAYAHLRAGRAQGLYRRLEPRRRLCARPRAAGA